MRTVLLTVLLMMSILTTSAEEITTGNLLPNAGDGVDWNSSSTDQINPGSSGYVSNNSDLNSILRSTSFFVIEKSTETSPSCL